MTGYVFSSFFACFELSSVQVFLYLRILLHLKCPPTKRIQTNRDLASVGIFASHLTHNYCPTFREAGKGDDPCVTLESPCQICGSFTQEQMLKISQRKRYIKKQKALTSTSKDDELDLLGYDVDSFTGSNADLESAADNLFTSPPRPQPLPFSSLSLKTPAKTVPPTPGIALQQKIEAKLEKSLVDSLNIHLQQQMGSVQASMLEAFQSLKEEITSKKQVKVDQTSTPKPGTSKAAVNLDPSPLSQPRAASNPDEMEVVLIII